MQYATPAPDGNGEVRAGWPVTNTLGVPGAWVSGYYLARIVLSDGSVPGAIPFVVREPAAAPAPSAVVVQVPVNTWQAYNAWGGKSLYDFNSGGSRANRVSFDRPYLWIGPGAQVMTSWELSLVRFLESEGVDVSYVTDVDVDRDPAVLTRHRVAITAGPRRVLDEGDSRRVRERPRCRDEPALHGREHGLLAGALRERTPHDGRLQERSRPGGRRSP